MATTLAHRFIGDTVVVRIVGDRIAAADWDAYVSDLEQDIDALRRKRFLTFATNAAPNAMQRREMEMKMRMYGIPALPSAVVSSSRLVRAATRVLQLFNPCIRCFAPNDVEQAMAFIAVPEAEQQACLQAADDLLAELETARSLAG
jgi:hypothetical protein